MISLFPVCGKLNDGPRRVSGAGPLSILLNGKGTFSDVITLKILKWGDYPGLSRWVLNAVAMSL